MHNYTSKEPDFQYFFLPLGHSASFFNNRVHVLLVKRCVVTMVTLNKVSWSNFKDNQTFIKLCHATICYVYQIFVGFCAEYNFGGNLIQQNFRTNCSKFIQNPCPSSYPSTDAYKCKFVQFFFFNCNVVEQHYQQLQLVLLILITFTKIRVSPGVEQQVTTILSPLAVDKMINGTCTTMRNAGLSISLIVV